jgi:hypothetical protein
MEPFFPFKKDKIGQKFSLASICGCGRQEGNRNGRLHATSGSSAPTHALPAASQPRRCVRCRARRTIRAMQNPICSVQTQPDTGPEPGHPRPPRSWTWSAPSSRVHSNSIRRRGSAAWRWRTASGSWLASARSPTKPRRKSDAARVCAQIFL